MSKHTSLVQNHIIRRNSHKPFYGDIVSKGEIVDNSYKVGCYERRSGVLWENPVSNKKEPKKSFGSRQAVIRLVAGEIDSTRIRFIELSARKREKFTCSTLARSLFTPASQLVV
jgi:hypothetical protein